MLLGGWKVEKLVCGLREGYIGDFIISCKWGKDEYSGMEEVIGKNIKS